MFSTFSGEVTDIHPHHGEALLGQVGKKGLGRLGQLPQSERAPVLGETDARPVALRRLEIEGTGNYR